MMNGEGRMKNASLFFDDLLASKVRLSRGLGSRRAAVFGFSFNLLASPNLLEKSFCCSKRGDTRQISVWPRYR